MRQETRPWGRFEVIYETDTTWLKRIIIAPGQSLSYQYHHKRTECWIAETPGVFAEVEGSRFALKANALRPNVIYPGDRHRLYNPGQTEVSVLEWVVGRPSEDDIVRLSDDYGRQ